MAFDPDAFLLEEDEEETIPQQPAQTLPSAGFDPDAFLAEEEEPAYQYDPSGFRRKKPVSPEAQKEIGTLEGIANAARNAFDSSRQALDIVGDVTPEEAKNIAKIEFEKQSRKVAPGYDEYQKAEGFDAVLAFAKNPIEVTSNIVAEGLAGSLPALGAGLAAGGVGAAAGSVVPIVGTGVGFTAGQVAGTFAGSLATEYGSKILEEMQEGGVDLTKPESIQGFFENEEAVAKARDKAISRGIPVAAFDAISAGIGGKLGRVIGKQFLTKTGEAAAELGVQAGLGGGGEVAGALAAGEPIEGKAVFAEVIGEAGPGAAEIITGRMADRAARVKAEEDAKIKAAAQLSDNLEQNSAPLTAAAVKSTTATTIEQDKLAAQLEEQLDADEIEKQVSGQLAVTKEPTAAAPAIKSKEEFTAIYSQVAPEELDAAEAGFTEQAVTAETEEARANAQNALEAIKEVKATVTPPAPTVEPTITPAVTPAVPTAQPPITDATQEIIQPEGVRQEPQDGTQVQPTEEAGVGDSLLGAARGQEEGQVAPTPTAKEPSAVKPAEQEELLGEAQSRYDSEIATYKNQKRINLIDDQELGKKLKAAGMRFAAEKRKITGQLTEKEAEAEAKREASNYIGKLVEVDGRPGKVVGNPFGRVRVKLDEGGATITATPDKVMARSAIAPEPIISEIPTTSELVGAEPTQPTIREVPEISPIVGAEPAAIVEQEPVAPVEPAPTETVKLPIEEPPVKISRGENFSMYGEYNVSIGDKKHRIYRDPERGYWYDADVQEEAVRSGSPEQGSPSLGLLSTETRKDAIAELVNKYKEERQAEIPLEAPAPVTTPPVTEAVTPAPAPAAEVAPAPTEFEFAKEIEAPRENIKKNMIRFASGMSAIGDLKTGTYARGGLKNYGVGFDVGLLSKNAIDSLAASVINLDTQVFIDSGAFSNFRKSLKEQAAGRTVEALDFDKIFEKYDSIVDAINKANPEERADYPRPLMVMPDIIGDQKASLDLIEKYKDRIAIDIGIQTFTPIIPIPLGELSLSQAYNRILEILNSNTRGVEVDPTNFIVGIPSNAKAVSKEDLANFLRESKPPRIHFLGAAADRNITPLIETVAQNSPETAVTADASKVRSAILNGVAKGKTRKQAIFDALYQEDDPEVILNRVSEEASKPKTAPTPATPAEPTGISIGNRIKLGKSPQTYTIEEVIPQSATERELGEQYYSVKNERTGETQVVEARDLKQVKGKGARKIATTAIDTTPEGILITPPDQKYTFEEVFDVAYDMFGGEIPEGFTIVNDSKDKDFEFKAAYIPESGEIIVNLAYLNKSDDIRDTITHELGHYIFGDPEFRAAFDQFIASLSPEARADLDAYVETAYNKYTGEIRLEEKMVRAFVDQFINEEQAPAWRSMLDAIKRFLNKLGFKFNISDRDAISVFTAALDRYKAGEAISREGGARLMAAEPRREQVAGMEREEARYITTPEGIIKQTNDVLREKFFDGTTVSPEKTTEAWGYISRLLDIKSGAANEFAGQINDVVDQDTNSEARMGASLFSVSLANYAAKLAAQGDSKMLKYMIRNVNSMPTDKYAGGKSDAGRALRSAKEYDIDGYGAIKIEVKAKVERTAATLFGTGSPTDAQVKAVEGAIKESDAQELGNPEEVAQEVEKVEKRTKRKITDKIEKIIGKGSLKGIIQSIKETPLEKQQEAGWIEKVVNDFLVNAGLSPEVAATASKLYESLIAERLAEARQKAFEDNLNKSAPWKDYLSRNSRLAKDSLKKIQEAIRTGALDPEQNVESIIAAESGWSGFTKDQYQKIVQLDNIINDPKQDDVTRREAMADLNKVISNAKLPVRFKDALGAYYVGNALLGIPTLTVNIASPIGFTIRNLMTDVGKFAFTDPARIPVAFETFMESMRSWYDQTSYAFKNQIYLNDVVEYLQGQNVLRELFDKGKKQWSEGKYAEGFVNMAVGMTQITGRVLSSLDQGAISMLENQNITRYAIEALANTKGKVPKDKLKEFANMVIDTRRKTIAQSIANGMSRDRAGVLADLAVKSEVISALSQYDINPMNVLDASINDALQSVGRNKTLTIKGVEQSQQKISDSGFLSYLPIKMLENVAEASGREGSAMQIFAKMLYGFALVPARVFHNVAWFSPYGFIRLGIDKYKKNKGEDSPYAMSLQTEAQYRQRLTDSIAGSVAMLGLAALSSASTDEDEDKKFKIVITGNGPSATTDKQYFDSWMKKWKPYSVHIVVNGNIIPINIGRGGEALFFPIMLAGALDDWKIKQKQNLTKKEPEDLSAIAQMLGSSFFALAQRGPYAAFTKPLFDASKDGRVTEELASQAGFFGETFIPVIGSSLSRNISDLFNDPVDRSSIEGAIYANTPVVGPWLGTKALNALGQPIRADDWGDKLYKLGVPVVFSFPKETPMNELNELILKQGSGPTIPTRANAQKRFGDVLTDKEFEAYVREYGKVMSDKMFKSRTKLANMKPADYDDELEKYARGYSIDGIKIKGASDSAVLAVKRMRQ